MSSTPDRMTSFKFNLLAAIGYLNQQSDEVKGLDVKGVVDERYETEVRHGRLYPNLDSLVRLGLVDKRKIDGRTNGYRLTVDGRKKLGERIQWLARGVLVEAPA